jgi:hypothetical protein
MKKYLGYLLALWCFSPVHAADFQQIHWEVDEGISQETLDHIEDRFNTLDHIEDRFNNEKSFQDSTGSQDGRIFNVTISEQPSSTPLSHFSFTIRVVWLVKTARERRAQDSFLTFGDMKFIM